MNETIVTLICVAALGLPYWMCSIFKRGGCKLEDLVVIILYIIGMVTGIYIFIGAFKIGQPSSQNAIWGGITGFILILYSLEKIVLAFRALFIPTIEPQRRTKEIDT